MAIMFFITNFEAIINQQLHEIYQLIHYMSN